MVYAVMIVIMVALDRWSKIWAQDVLTKVDTIPVIQNVFHMTYVENRGAAFSILNGRVGFLILFTGLVLVVLFFLLFLGVKKEESKVLLMALTAIIGGAIGNIYDRAILGYVVDYFDFRLINFAVFNVADVFVVCGSILLGIYLIFIEGKKAKKQ
ncbi:MAG: signal peptidase II [Clostridia bacterium]|nr:signal peptidase II [Clostridia bacterium]